MAGGNGKILQGCSHLTLVSVIASFDTSGSLTPLYVRIGEESLKIYNATLTDVSTYKQYCFNCEVMDGDTVKPLKLIYHLGENVWSVPNHREGFIR